jgi:hypothetical protein
VLVNQRFVDCGNGTVTDEVTGLIWLQDSSCLGMQTYVEGNQAAQGLQSRQCGLTDSSVPGQWRLPTISEWQVMTRQAVALGCVAPDGSKPVLRFNGGIGCYSDAPDGDGPGFWQRAFPGVRAMLYWSSTTYEASPDKASAISLGNGNTYLTTAPSEPLEGSGPFARIDLR